MTTYCVDLARRRSKCRAGRCALGGFIGQGELRFSSYGAAYSSVQQSSHLHVQCVTKELALTVAAVTFDDVSRVQGFHDLTADDQKVVKARFHRLLGQPDTPAPAAKKKKKKAVFVFVVCSATYVANILNRVSPPRSTATCTPAPRRR